MLCVTWPGNCSRDDVERYLGMGFQGVLAKPFSVSDVEAVLHSVGCLPLARCASGDGASVSGRGSALAGFSAV